MSCPHCQTAAISNAKFCHQCGQSLQINCPACGSAQRDPGGAGDLSTQDRLSEFDETLAIHFKKSIATDKATDYLIRSAQRPLDGAFWMNRISTLKPLN